MKIGETNEKNLENAKKQNRVGQFTSVAPASWVLHKPKGVKSYNFARNTKIIAQKTNLTNKSNTKEFILDVSGFVSAGEGGRNKTIL